LILILFFKAAAFNLFIFTSYLFTSIYRLLVNDYHVIHGILVTYIITYMLHISSTLARKAYIYSPVTSGTNSDV